MTRGRGENTRARAQEVALRLFSERGYEATSLREVAAELGINKASLYHHFASKDDLLRSVLDDRGREAHELAAWVAGQPPAPDLLERAVLRWVDSFTVDKLRGLRLLARNPLLASRLTGGREDAKDVGEELTRALAAVRTTPSPPAAELLVRMAFSAVRLAVVAAEGTDVSDEDTVITARAAARALLGAAGELTR